MNRNKYEDSHLLFINFFEFIYKLLEFAYWKRRYKTYRKKFSIHKNFEFNGKQININGNGDLTIKGYGQMCYNTFIELPKYASLEIGKNVVISKNVVFYINDFDYKKFINGEFLIHKNHNKMIIGNNVFIQPFCFLEGNITIGDNVIIMPHSSVKEDIPSNSIYQNGKIIPYKRK